MKKSFAKISLALGSIGSLLLSMASAQAALPNWTYDAGPDRQTKMGKELIDLTASIPDMPRLSMDLTKKQKFRPAFGPIPWRMLQGKNKVKMLFIGQDGTHIAEAAGRPATAGFGGRAQDLANYFGVQESAAFINTYAFTIKGQYGAYNTPYVYKNKSGDYETRFANFVDNKLWLMSIDQRSPITKWRNDLIDWIIRNNKDSMKLIVTFGGAARDSISAYAESKGAKVGTRYGSQMDRIQIAETALGYAGGNNQFPYVVSRKGKDLYGEVLGKRIDYKKADQQKAVQDAIKNNLQAFLPDMVFTKTGPYKNGLIHPGQLGGYDMGKMTVNGIKTRSLKGLKLNDGTVIKNDILIVELPHPSFLSRQTKAQAGKSVGAKVKALVPYKKKGWKIAADPGQVNQFDKGQAYKYSRADIGPEFYDFGTPGTRMVPVSTASRMSGHAHVIVFGTRDRAPFDKKKIAAMTAAKPSTKFSTRELFNARPRTAALRYVYDAGPGEKLAKIMKENLDVKAIQKAKPGKSWKSHGAAAYNVQQHPELADFGHYRGTFKNPKVLIMADPHGYDDMITARALTGSRGQLLHGLMQDLKVGDQYLVLKTVPFGMDGATTAEWKVVLKQTSKYRKALMREILANGKPKLIITDGPYAKAVMSSYVKGTGIKVVNIRRSSSDVKAGLKEAAAELGVKASLKMLDIPRSHLSFYARLWEGTSGDRIIPSSSKKYFGLAFAEVAPSWATKQRTSLKSDDRKGFMDLVKVLAKYKMAKPGESIPKYLERTNIDPSID